MSCPHCNAPDPGSGKFCIHCGQPVVQAQTSPPAPMISSAPSMQMSLPPSPQPSMRAAEYAAPVGKFGAGTVAPASIWGPFAGYGTRGRHVAWLLDDMGDRAEMLRQAVTKRFLERRIPDAQVEPRILASKGVLVDQRPYYMVKRGRATTGLYLAQLGKDMYISQVSYFKGPISTVRVILVLAMALFVLLYPTMFSNALRDVTTSIWGGVSGLGNIFGILCCLGPLYLASFVALTLMLLFALYKFVTEKDILAPVRVQPNEFDQDDLIAMEKAVEQTVRESLDVVGIERNLMPPATTYGIRERII